VGVLGSVCHILPYGAEKFYGVVKAHQSLFCGKILAKFLFSIGPHAFVKIPRSELLDAEPMT
jgi:hypothetical protein